MQRSHYANVTIHNQEGIEYKSEAPRTQTLADDSAQALKPCTFAYRSASTDILIGPSLDLAQRLQPS